MDQDAMVIAKFDGGGRLVSSLNGRGFKVETAFWVKLSGEQKWLLYLASPVVDEKGPGFAYGIIYAVLRDAPEWGIDPFEVTVVGIENPMVKAAVDFAKSRAATEPAAVSNARVIPFHGSTLGRMAIEGAFIYPQGQPGVTVGSA